MVSRMDSQGENQQTKIAAPRIPPQYHVQNRLPRYRFLRTQDDGQPNPRFGGRLVKAGPEWQCPLRLLHTS